MDKKSPVTTDLIAIGHNFQTYSFQNGEEYKFYFYANYFSNRVSMSIYNEAGVSLTENREIAVSDDLCPNISELKGFFSVEGAETTISSVDNTSKLFYNYTV